jgi:hypothetical protein
MCKYALSNWSRQNLNIHTTVGVVVIAFGNPRDVGSNPISAKYNKLPKYVM